MSGWTLLSGLIAALVGYRFGYETAHLTIAEECKRLGGFYVNKKTYRCSAIEDHQEQSK